MDLNIREHIRPVSDFRKDTAGILKKLNTDRHPIVLTQRGRSIAVILDVETYERLEYESGLRKAVHEGLEDADKGRTIPHNQVMKEMRQRMRRRSEK